MATAFAKASEVKHAEMLAGLRSALHEMSQPMTMLLCVLECADGMEASAEMKEMIGAGVQACTRLSETVRAMQMQVKGAVEGSGD